MQNMILIIENFFRKDYLVPCALFTGIASMFPVCSICVLWYHTVCLLTDSDVARGSYNIQQVQLAFAHAYRVLCNAVCSDTRHSRNNSTAEQFLCTNSILSGVICMPHQHDLSDHRGDFSRRKLMSSSRRKLSDQKQTTPHKKTQAQHY